MISCGPLIHKLVSKKLPNSPILIENYELDSIMVNKGRIHKKLREFFRYHWNLIKYDDELKWKIRDFSILKEDSNKNP